MTFPTSFYVDSIVNQLEHTTIGAFDDAPSILHSLHFHELANCWLLLFPYQDGSCNGLQHYAALGRDYVSVVLCCTFCLVRQIDYLSCVYWAWAVSRLGPWAAHPSLLDDREGNLVGSCFYKP